MPRMPEGELESWVSAVLECPRDWGLRQILGDFLEDHGDPRTARVRLVPALRALPLREEPRLDCQVWTWWSGPRRRNSRRGWPVVRIVGAAHGRHDLSRLLSLALVHDLMYFPADGERLRRIDDYLARCWLSACGLVDAHRRDQGWAHAVLAERSISPGYGRNVCARHWLSVYVGCDFWNAASLWACRSGRRGCFVNVAQNLLVGLASRSGRNADLATRALAWSRVLDLYEAFVAHVVTR